MKSSCSANPLEDAVRDDVIEVTRFLKGSPADCIAQAKLEKRTGELRVSFSQGGVGLMKWVQVIRPNGRSHPDA